MTLETGKQTENLVDRHHRRQTSLRTRITLATTITSVLAALAIGFFALVRNAENQSILGNQLQTAEKEKSESQIQSIVDQEAQAIDYFFSSIDQIVISTSSYAGKLLSQGSNIGTGAYWNTDESLSILSSGAWDNSNSEPAAIFAPSNTTITGRKANELNTIVHLDFIAPDILETNSDIVAIYYISSEEITVYYPNIDLANLVPPDFKATEQPFYTIAIPENNPQRNSVWTPPYQDPALTGLIVTNSTPVYDDNGRFRGVVGADVQLTTITERVLKIQVGETGYAFLMDSDGHILAMPASGYNDFELTPEEIPVNESPQLTLLERGPQELRTTFEVMAQGSNGLLRINLHDTEHYFAYTPIASTGYSLGVLVPVSEMDVAFREAQALVESENQATRNFGLILLVAVISAALLVSLGVSRFLTNPLNQLTSVAQQVSTGDFSARASETSVAEVNVLSNAFNTMTGQLKDILAGLEERVTERTLELETANKQIQHRATQFEAIAQVARDISMSQDLDALLPRITNVVSENFGFYHVGIFLLDAEKVFAVLRAANSPGGKRMLERGHQLKVGEIGIVGYATGQGRPRIALDTGADAVYFDNPDLPDTHSEMALPLIVGGQVIGALDVQSREPDAFSQEDVRTLSTLADQVGIAIQNARLYEETRQALAQLQTLYEQFTQAGWSQFKRARKLSGVLRKKSNTTFLRKPLSDEDSNGHSTLEIPIELRGHKIGQLKVLASSQREWTQDDIDIATAIIERSAIAMENARLLDDAQRRANREQIIGEISTTVGSSSNMEEILRSAVQELGRKMGGAEVVLELGTDIEESVEPDGSIQQ